MVLGELEVYFAWFYLKWCFDNNFGTGVTDAFPHNSLQKRYKNTFFCPDPMNGLKPFLSPDEFCV